MPKITLKIMINEPPKITLYKLLKLNGLLFWVTSFSILFSVSIRAAEVCPGVFTEEDVKLKLTEVEKRLVCGDAAGDTVEAKAWSRVPPAQAQLQIKALLQTRGYGDPRFSIVGDVLHIRLGSPTVITQVTLVGLPEGVDFQTQRGIIGQKLTPERLTDIENDVDRQLRFHGYPCPHVTSTAGQRTGIVVVNVSAGLKLKVVDVDVTDALGLKPGTLRRYDAFNIGDFFDSRDLELTERRIVGDNVLAATNFSSQCKGDGVHIHQFVDGGPPRSLSLGIGADTEEILIGRASWRHTRLDHRASIAELTLYTSFLKQQGSGDVRWFYSDNSRKYIKPFFSLLRDREVSNETDTLEYGAAFGSTWDENQRGWLAEFGPDWQYTNTVTSPLGPLNSRNLLLKGQIQLMSHNFEYFKSEPRSGYRVAIIAGFSHQAITSTVTAQKIGLTFEKLWNYQAYNPPLLIFGWRSGVFVTLTDVDLSDPKLPFDPFRSFLGGSTDLRGFSRQELPASGLGALTAVFTSFEARYIDILPFKLQPFVFVDLGALGTQSMSLALPYYYSPGLGMRWDSPVGSIRANLAHGFLWAPNQAVDQSSTHWQFYFSFGEEF